MGLRGENFIILKMIAVKCFRKVQRFHYSCMNSLVPYQGSRWAFFAFLVMAYLFNTPSPCSDLTTYLIAFYLLYLPVNYFIPKGVQDQESLEDEEDDELFSLGSSEGSIFKIDYSQLEWSGDKPLLREMSEVQIWWRASLAMVLGVIISYFRMLQIDVFWPLLLVYFVGLAFYTILKILKTMKKFQYGPADFLKQPL